MTVQCFGCEVVIEGDDLDTIASRFVTHAVETHDWEYPEPALDTYARNVAEASERLTGGTDRLTEIGEVVVHRVTSERIEDWLQFFDHDAFAGNPAWASCYCLEPHVPEGPNDERPWREQRAMMIERFQSGTTDGYLAYSDGQPAGWVNASLRSEYEKYRSVDPDGPEATSVIGLSCFIVSPPYQQHGIASRLLDRVIVDASERGAKWIEAYPKNSLGGSTAPYLYRGPRSMYEERGFSAVEVRDDDTVVRRRVG